MDSVLEQALDNAMGERDVTGVLVIDEAGFCLAARGDLNPGETMAGWLSSLYSRAQSLATYLGNSPKKPTGDISELLNRPGPPEDSPAQTTTSSLANANATTQNSIRSLGATTSASASGTALNGEDTPTLVQVLTSERIILIKEQGDLIVCIAKQRHSHPVGRSSPSTPMLEMPRFT
ncbi:hypothetical protein IWQ61_007905 [Dispira simplex]|nr:hypothetical protein IWQ61_007905 [Dispira simplex]